MVRSPEVVDGGGPGPDPDPLAVNDNGSDTVWSVGGDHFWTATVRFTVTGAVGTPVMVFDWLEASGVAINDTDAHNGNIGLESYGLGSDPGTLLIVATDDLGRTAYRHFYMGEP